MRRLAASCFEGKRRAATRHHINFFRPSCELKGKRRQGAKVMKRYHAPATPYDRALAHPALDEAVKRGLHGRDLLRVTQLNECARYGGKTFSAPNVDAQMPGAPRDYLFPNQLAAHNAFEIFDHIYQPFAKGNPRPPPEQFPRLADIRAPLFGIILGEYLVNNFRLGVR
jgi:hypothetical protein